ncbi:MAG: peptidoglycan-binding protein [Patescibacteria group bacterium]|nr:peptidoglycan-binding protein [Patescibacteria group bacterium]
MKKYILGAALFFVLLVTPLAQAQASGLTESQATILINVVKASPGTPASAFIDLITAFSGVTTAQASSLISVVQASPGTTASAFVPLLTSFTSNVPTNQTTTQTNQSTTQTNATTYTKPTVSVSNSTPTAGTAISFTWSAPNGSGCYWSRDGQYGGALTSSPISVSTTGLSGYYNMTASCSYPNGQTLTSNQVPVTVAPQTNTTAPTVLSTTFSQDSSMSVPGAPVKLYWTSTGASSCSVSIRYDSSGTGAGYGSWISAGLENSINSPSTGAVMTSGSPGLYQAQLYCNGGSLGTNVKYLTHTVTASTASVSDAFSSAANAGASQNISAFNYTWNRDLQIGSPYSADVTALQTALMKEGVYTGEITGGFYDQTYLAVKAFQQKYGINATGYFGPQTREKLNALY